MVIESSCTTPMCNRCPETFCLCEHLRGVTICIQEFRNCLFCFLVFPPLCVLKYWWTKEQTLPVLRCFASLRDILRHIVWAICVNRSRQAQADTHPWRGDTHLAYTGERIFAQSLSEQRCHRCRYRPSLFLCGGNTSLDPRGSVVSGR